MGLKFRKSVKVGPARINFSNSGVGYSVGAGGLRYTKSAKRRSSRVKRPKAKTGMVGGIAKLFLFGLGIFCVLAVCAAVFTLVQRFKWVILGAVAVIAVGVAAYFIVKRKTNGQTVDEE